MSLSAHRFRRDAKPFKRTAYDRPKAGAGRLQDIEVAPLRTSGPEFDFTNQVRGKRTKDQQA